jgi:predicted DNA binding CopG/RHH family protein
MNMAKKVRLSKEEREMEASLARGEWKSVGGEKENKEARINIRLSPALLDEIRARAAGEGVPYQTFIASALHKIVTDQYVPRKQWEEVLERIAKKAG